jgi:hypothetical protein
MMKLAERISKIFTSDRTEKSRSPQLQPLTRIVAEDFDVKRGEEGAVFLPKKFDTQYFELGDRRITGEEFVIKKWERDPEGKIPQRQLDYLRWIEENTRKRNGESSMLVKGIGVYDKSLVMERITPYNPKLDPEVIVDLQATTYKFQQLLLAGFIYSQDVVTESTWNPDNIVVDRNGQVRIIDPSIFATVEANHTDTAKVDYLMPRQGMIELEVHEAASKLAVIFESRLVSHLESQGIKYAATPISSSTNEFAPFGN